MLVVKTQKKNSAFRLHAVRVLFCMEKLWLAGGDKSYSLRTEALQGLAAVP